MVQGRRREGSTIIKMKPNVPEEIVLEILSKLPVRSLLRFKCVSKRWRFLISDPKFNVSVQRQSVIVGSVGNRSDFSFHCINNDGSVVEIPRPKLLQFFKGVRIEGSCNGLLLLNQGDDFFIWNPLTGFCNEVLSLGRYGIFLYCFAVPRLCYDSSTDDYKVVILIGRRDFCIVGSFRNKSWTTIHFPYCKDLILQGPTVNEHLHWLVSESSPRGGRFLIVYFVMQTNEFVEVPMPECDRTVTIVGLGILNGCLSLARVTNNIEYYNIEVLVMKKYAEKESWTSFFVISEFPGLQRIYSLVPLCCMKDMVLLLQQGSEIDVILAYDLNKKSHWDFPIPCNGLTVDAAMFVESLVSPPSHTNSASKGRQSKWKRWYV